MKDFIPYEPALALKELGFDEPCLAIHSFVDGELNFMYVNTFHSNDDVNEKSAAAPLYQQAFRWFRDNCDWPIETWIQPYLSINPRTYEGLYWRRGETESVGIYDTYEEAELACLIKLIEIVKEIFNNK
jgi:hypothetical protein